MATSISNYTCENRGRVLLLFLLFLLAIYELVTAGLPAFAVICILPIIVLFIYVAFAWRMTAFWALIIINYFLQMKDINLPVPMSLPNEMLELTLLAVALIDVRQDTRFARAGNLMLLAIMIWVGLCLIEILNNSCGLGINVAAWFGGFRILAMQLVWIFLVFCIYVASPKTLITFLKIWALLSLFSTFWTYKQVYWGMTHAENCSFRRLLHSNARH